MNYHRGILRSYICALLGLLIDSIVINTKIGRIRGILEYVAIENQTEIVTKFTGIPYAESPVKVLRFKKPVPKAPFTEIFEARQLPMACMQASQDLEGTYEKYVNFTEDCLSLNIYIPRDLASSSDARRSFPVMVWIHGGSFVEGTSGVYSAEALSLYGEVIVVFINYRLGMFGFLRSADGKFPGNQGLWDQHLALKWIHNNIDAFGGNPNNVTIFGTSAGAGAVLFQSMYAGNTGLFQRVIAQSGSVLSPWAVLEKTNAEQYIEAVGCKKPTDSETTTCLTSKTARQLQTPAYSFDYSPRYKPSIDNEFLVESPRNIIFGTSERSAEARHFFKSLDLMTGVNDLEGAMHMTFQWPYYFGLKNADNLTITRKQFLDTVLTTVINGVFRTMDRGSKDLFQTILDHEYTNWSKPNDVAAIRETVMSLNGDIDFNVPAVETVQGHSKLQKGATYFYEYKIVPTVHVWETPHWAKGASHGDERISVFGYPLSNASFISYGNYTDDDIQGARAVVTLWSNFAKSGNPNEPTDVLPYTKTAWPRYTTTDQFYLEISNKMSTNSVKDRFRGRWVNFWTEVIPAIRNKLSKNQEIVTNISYMLCSNILLCYALMFAVLLLNVCNPMLLLSL